MKHSTLSPARAVRLFIVLVLLLASSSFLVAAEEGEHVEHHHQEHQEAVPEEPEPQEERREEVERQHEEPPVQQEEAAPVQEEEPVQQKQEETPPQQEEPPQQQEEEKPAEPEKPAKLDDALFEVNVFECKAPTGEPVDREGKLLFGSIMTLCFRPKQETRATLVALDHMDYSAKKGPTQAAMRNNEAAGPTTRALCPLPEQPTLCIAASKIDDEFFAKSYTNAAATGELTVRVEGEDRRVPFKYEFDTAKETKPPPVEHEFFEMPTTPPSFPCSNEIRLWMLAALVLTLLEFAFSPSSEEEGGSNKSKEGGAGKKKKPKKE